MGRIYLKLVATRNSSLYSFHPQPHPTGYDLDPTQVATSHTHKSHVSEVLVGCCSAMVATNLKSETKSLMDQRAAMEAEMDALIETLSGPGGPGLSGNLIDSEGFPRSDIDIPAVRAQRKRLAELRSDHKDITERIHKNIEILHSAKLPQNAESKNIGTSVPSESNPMEVDPVVRISFATIDEIAEDSPAAEDGLQLGDEIVKFGKVEIGERLQERLSSEAQSNQGHPVSVLVMRRGVVLDVTVTPRPWRGRGLLGCHFLFK